MFSIALERGDDIAARATSIIICAPGSGSGSSCLSVMPLSESGTRHTALVRWRPGTRFNPHRHFGGEEIYVLDGVFEDEFGSYPAGTWMRSPHRSAHCPFSIEGCIILVKTGHFPHVQRKAALTTNI